MFGWFFIIIALIFSVFGLIAFIWLLQGNAVSINLMTHEEFAGLPQEVKNLYKKAVLDIIVPAFHRAVAKAYNETVKQKTYPVIEKRVLDEATAFAKNMEAYIGASVPTNTTTTSTSTSTSPSESTSTSATIPAEQLPAIYNPVKNTSAPLTEGFSMFEDVMKNVSTLRY